MHLCRANAQLGTIHPAVTATVRQRLCIGIPFRGGGEPHWNINSNPVKAVCASALLSEEFLCSSGRQFSRQDSSKKAKTTGNCDLEHCAEPGAGEEGVSGQG